jgi:hypothetical protein
MIALDVLNDLNVLNRAARLVPARAQPALIDKRVTLR